MKKVDVTSLQSARPMAIRVFNYIGYKTRLDKDQVIKAARRKSNLRNFGDDSFMYALDQLITSINEEARLHKFGSFIVKQRLINILQNRLRAEDHFVKHPEILEQEIAPPIIIIGLQRTGTTKLHRLLGIHPKLRALLSWEALNPSPFSNDSDAKKRIKQGRLAQRALRYMSPQFFAIHPVEYDAPEEDILLNEMTFLSTVPEATMHVPQYARWVESQDHTPAYTYMIKMLQLLQWQNKSGHLRWILKTPQNMEFLQLLVHIFPNAKFIHTYRDPLKIIASFSSMVYHSRRIFSDQVVPQECAAHWLKKDKYMIDKCMNIWDLKEGYDRLDISYYNLVDDSKNVLKSILNYCGLTYTSDYDKQVDEALETEKQYRYGRHNYKLEDFGLDKKTVDQVFTSYRQKFDIPYE